MAKRTMIQLGAAVLGGAAFALLMTNVLGPTAGALAGIGGAVVLFVLAGSWVGHNPLP
jgi:hypothetical protein